MVVVVVDGTAGSLSCPGTGGRLNKPNHSPVDQKSHQWQPQLMAAVDAVLVRRACKHGLDTLYGYC